MQSKCEVYFIWKEYIILPYVRNISSFRVFVNGKNIFTISNEHLLYFSNLYLYFIHLFYHDCLLSLDLLMYKMFFDSKFILFSELLILVHKANFTQFYYKDISLKVPRRSKPVYSPIHPYSKLSYCKLEKKNSNISFQWFPKAKNESQKIAFSHSWSSFHTTQS